MGFIALLVISVIGLILGILHSRKARRKNRLVRRSRVRKLLASLESGFGFTTGRSPVLAELKAEGRVGDYQAHITLVMPPDEPDDPVTEGETTFLIRLTGECFPPFPALIGMKDEKAEDDRARLAPADLPALNSLIGREAFGEQLLDDLRLVWARAESFAMTSGEIVVGLTCDTLTPSRLRETVIAIGRVAAGIKAVSRTIDWYLPALCLLLRRPLNRGVRLRQPQDRGRQVAFIRRLAERYPDEPLARDTLFALLESPDIEIALQAGEALRLDVLALATRRIDDLDPPVQARALQYLCEHRPPGAIDFVIDFYNRSGSAYLKTAIINAFCERGGIEVLAVLDEAGRDDTLPEELRRKAGEAAEAIRGSAPADGEK
jgi:hypothetical protein